MFYEGFFVGQNFQLPAFGVFPEEIADFSRLTRDDNPLHGEDEAFHAERNLIFKKRVVHGMLTMSRLMGALHEAGIISGTCVAFAEASQKFLRPVLPGDEVTTLVTVVAKDDIPEDDRLGFVTFSATASKLGKPVLVATLKIVVVRKKPGLSK